MDQSELLLQLTRLGVRHCHTVQTERPDWDAVEALAEKQGLTAIVLDGINQLPADQRPPKDQLLNWIGMVMQGYEYRYSDYEKAIVELSKFYGQNGIKMMVLKGYGLSQNYPEPSHRPCGDIDIWNFGVQKQADELIRQQFNLQIDNSELHHSCFDWKGYLVENHYDFLIVQSNKTNAKLESILKDLAMDDSKRLEVGGQVIYIPSPNLNALFLLRHMLMHFVAIGITIRHLLDWAFFWEKYGKEVDADWLIGVLNEYNMATFFNIINAICVDDLGFESKIFPSVQFSPFLKDKVLKDILQPDFDWEDAFRLKFLPRLVFKYKRWKSGSWKRRMCYKESEWSSFWTNIRTHLLQPTSI